MRLLIADRQPVTRYGLRGAVEGRFGESATVVGEAEDGRRALELARTLLPDAVLAAPQSFADRRMAVVRELRALPSPPVVLVFLEEAQWDAVQAALAAGARAVLLASAPADRVAAALPAAVAGAVVLSDAVSRALQERAGVGAAGLSPSVLRSIARLDGRQRQLLALIGEGLSNAQIAVRTGVAETTVRAAVSRLLAALPVENRVQAGVLAYRAGLSGRG